MYHGVSNYVTHNYLFKPCSHLSFKSRNHATGYYNKKNLFYAWCTLELIFFFWIAEISKQIFVIGTNNLTRCLDCNMIYFLEWCYSMGKIYFLRMMLAILFVDHWEIGFLNLLFILLPPNPSLSLWCWQFIVGIYPSITTAIITTMKARSSSLPSYISIIKNMRYNLSNETFSNLPLPESRLLIQSYEFFHNLTTTRPLLISGLHLT